jgi:multidrug efflux pump subunit AcrB
MYLLLTIQFRSYAQPFFVLAVIPFGLVGAVLGHFVMGMTLTMFSFFGIVALSGVVINDSIVLIDFINARLREGRTLEEALEEAGRQRFRPVLLTSVTTIVALLPILAESSLQVQILIPMATSLAFGLMIATAWVLLLVPSIYSLYGHHIKPTAVQDAEQNARDLAAQQDERVEVLA